MAFDIGHESLQLTDRECLMQRAYLSDIAMCVAPILVAFPELSIHNNWGEFVDQLNTHFGQPDLAQASECALRALNAGLPVCQQYRSSSPNMQPYGVDDVALYGEFYQGLAERIKRPALSLDRP